MDMCIRSPNFVKSTYWYWTNMYLGIRSPNCVACILRYFIGSCQVQQRRRSRAQIQPEGGSRFYPDHAGSACVPWAPFLRSRWPENQWCGPPPPPPSEQAGQGPFRPLLGPTPPLAKMKIETRLGGNHTSASDSRSEAIDWARGGCGDHFGFYRASVRGRAGDPRVITTHTLEEIRPGRYDQDTTMLWSCCSIFFSGNCIIFSGAGIILY